jgi:hypothetical protein
MLKRAEVFPLEHVPLSPSKEQIESIIGQLISSRLVSLCACASGDFPVCSLKYAITLGEQMERLKDSVNAVIDKLFPPSEQGAVRELLLEECSDKLPLVKSAELMERIQLAVLKLSKGKAGRLLDEIKSARRDWRDVLVAAGFGNDLEAHLKWAREICK